MAIADTRKVAVRAGLAAVAAAGVVAAGAATPANAQITSFCSGTAGEVSVPGDLIVRADQWCALDGTTVHGDMIVRAGANLIASDATFNGRVRAQPDAYVDLTSSAVADRVILRDAFGLLAIDSDLGENVVARSVDPEAPSGAVQSIGSSIAGHINAQVGAVWIGDSTAAGNVVGNGVDYVDVVNTVVKRQLRVSGATDGSVICDSEIYGPVEYAGNQGPVQLGGDTLVAGCEGANYWHQSVSIDDTDGDVHVSDNIVRADLTGAGNDPAPAGEGNRVRGDAGGQFEEMAPAGSSKSLSAEGSKVQDRGQELQDRFEARRDRAVAVATMMGPANL